MRSAWIGILMVVLLGMLSACGGGSSSSTGNTPPPASATVSGVVATGAPVALSQVTVTDANGRTVMGTTDANGNYTIDATGLTFPLLAKATYTSATGAVTVLYSYAKTSGTVNVNPLTNAAVVACTGTFDGTFTPSAQTSIGNNLETKVAQLEALLAQFGAGNVNPVTGAYTIGSGLDSIFDILDLTVSATTGILTVKTKFDGATVATGNLSNISSLSIPASAVPIVDNTTVHIGTLSATSGEVGSHVMVPVTGLNTVNTAKNHILIGGIWVPFLNTVGYTTLNAWIPPGCIGGKVAVLTVNEQGQAIMGTTSQTYTVTTQHDYAIGLLLMTNNSIGLSGNFPAGGSVNVKFTQGASMVTVPTTSYFNSLMVTIPAAINVLTSFTVQVTSTDGTKSSNVYSFTP